jgi:hypothetical protein
MNRLISNKNITSAVGVCSNKPDYSSKTITREEDIMSRTRVVAINIPFDRDFKLPSYRLRV